MFTGESASLSVGQTFFDNVCALISGLTIDIKGPLFAFQRQKFINKLEFEGRGWGRKPWGRKP